MTDRTCQIMFIYVNFYLQRSDRVKIPGGMLNAQSYTECAQAMLPEFDSDSAMDVSNVSF